MRSLLSSYRAPLIVSVIGLLGLSWWVWTEWNDRAESRVDHSRRFAEGLTVSVEVELHRIQQAGAVDSADVEIALDWLLSRSPEVRFAAVLLGEDELITAGGAPDDLEFTSSQTEMLTEDTLIIWRFIHLEPPRPHRGREGQFPPPRHGGQPPPRYSGQPPPPPHGRFPPPHSTSDGQVDDQALSPPRPARSVVLALGMDRLVSEAGSNDLEDILFRLALGVIGIIAVATAWMMGIRSSGVSADLAVERQRREHLEEMSLAAAGLAHEIKNPLGLIAGLAHRVGEDDSIDDDTQDAVDQIIDAADQATSRLGEFIHYAKMRAPQPTSVAVDDVVTKAIGVLKGDFEAAGVAIETRLDDSRIVADEEMLLQILLNLLLNSMQASDEGGRVSVELERRGAKTVLTVADEGRGIPDELLGDIFKPYVTGRAEGHGLGLSIVKRLANRHGWTIGVDTVPDEGTRVWISEIAIASDDGVR